MNADGSIFNIPPMHYFVEGNKYSGSAHKIFRYKIYPSDVLECVVWHGLYAIDSIADDEIKARESFPLTDDGRVSMIEWLEQRYMEFNAEHTKLIDI